MKTIFDHQQKSEQMINKAFTATTDKATNIYLTTAIAESLQAISKQLDELIGLKKGER